MVWYYGTLRIVGRLKIAGVSSHDIPVSDVIREISDAVQIPLSLDSLPEGIASLSKAISG